MPRDRTFATRTSDSSEITITDICRLEGGVKVGDRASDWDYGWVINDRVSDNVYGYVRARVRYGEQLSAMVNFGEQVFGERQMSYNRDAHSISIILVGQQYRLLLLLLLPPASPIDV